MNKLLVVAALLVTLLLLAGCASSGPTAASPTANAPQVQPQTPQAQVQTPSTQPVAPLSPAPEQKKEDDIVKTVTNLIVPKITSKEPKDIALNRSDMPDNYALKDRREETRDDISQEGIDNGWQKGYYVFFQRVGDSILDVTNIEQFISIYPEENMEKVVNAPQPNENRTVKILPSPNIGDQSIGYYGEVVTNSKYNITKSYYAIQFRKLNVLETFYMSGSSLDYEFLKETAKKAEAKTR